MIRQSAFFGLAICASVSAAAGDNRVRTVAYEADKVVVIQGRTGIQSTILFADDERIENIGVGDSSAWQITPNRRASLLFVKPLVVGNRTNMTVVTNRRTYLFDLVGSGKGAAPVYTLKFSYPEEELAAAAAKMADAASPAPVPAAPTATQTAPVEHLNFAWTSKGFARLLPSRVFDDGKSLYLAWRQDTPLPAILTQSDDRVEATLNYKASGEYLVISPVPSNVILRYGKKTATVLPAYAQRRTVAAPPPAPSPAKAEAPARVIAKAEPAPHATTPEARTTVAPAAASASASLAGGAPEQALPKLQLPKNLYSDQLSGNE